jgi:hypothetical protein
MSAWLSRFNRELDHDPELKRFWLGLLKQDERKWLPESLEYLTGPESDQGYRRWQGQVENLSDAVKDLRRALKSVQRVEHEVPAKHPSALDLLIVLMEEYAKRFDEVKKSRSALRKAMRTKRMRLTKQLVILLPTLEYIISLTPDGKPHYEHIACLLTAAYMGHGRDVSVGPDELKQLRHRHRWFGRTFERK